MRNNENNEKQGVWGPREICILTDFPSAAYYSRIHHVGMHTSVCYVHVLLQAVLRIRNKGLGSGLRSGSGLKLVFGFGSGFEFGSRSETGQNFFFLF